MPTISETDYNTSLAAITDRQTAFRLCLAPGAASSMLMEDLEKFCRAKETCWSEDARHHARLEGRREVWLHIREYLDNSAEEILVKLNGPITVVRPAPIEDDNDG